MTAYEIRSKHYKHIAKEQFRNRTLQKQRMNAGWRYQYLAKGQRYIKFEKRNKKPYSVNTEVWQSDFFWPFFTNYTYEEIMNAVLDVLLTSISSETVSEEIEIPELLIETFGECCKQEGLIDDNGCFNNPHKLVHFFCNK